MWDKEAIKWDTLSNLSMLVHGCFQSKPMNKHKQSKSRALGYAAPTL